MGESYKHREHHYREARSTLQGGDAGMRTEINLKWNKVSIGGTVCLSDGTLTGAYQQCSHLANACEAAPVKDGFVAVSVTSGYRWI